MPKIKSLYESCRMGRRIVVMKLSARSVILNATVTQYTSSVNGVSLPADYPHGRVTVHGCAKRSPLTGCQVTSRPSDRFSRYSEWLDTFRTALVYSDLRQATPYTVHTVSCVRSEKIPGSRSSWRINFVWWYLIFMGPQYGTCLMSPF